MVVWAFILRLNQAFYDFRGVYVGFPCKIFCLEKVSAENHDITPTGLWELGHELSQPPALVLNSREVELGNTPTEPACG